MLAICAICQQAHERKPKGWVGGLTKEMNSPGIYYLDNGGKGHSDIESSRDYGYNHRMDEENIPSHKLWVRDCFGRFVNAPFTM